MMKTLIISGHPDLSTSVANQTILEELEKALPDAEIRKLDQLYPDAVIDVEAEQKALLEADLIVWQFPFWWYSLPWLMKKWLDEVFLHGFSHGSTAKLGGKKLLVSFTTGAPAEAYTGGEGSLGDIQKMVEIFQATAILCGLDYQGALYVHGVGYTTRDDEAKTESQRADAKAYAAKLIARIQEITG